MRRNKDGRRRFSVPRSRLIDTLVGWPRRAKRLVMISADLVGVVAALWAAYALKFDSLSAGFEQDLFLYISAAATSTLLFSAIGLYRAVVRYIGRQVLISIVMGVLGSGLVIWLSGSLFSLQPVPVSVVVIYGLLLLVWVTATRIIARWLLTPAETEVTRVVIYGAGEAGAEPLHRLARPDLVGQRDLHP